MTKKESLRKIREALLSAGIPDAQTDAWLLYSHVTGETRSAFFLAADAEMEVRQAERLFALARRRAKRVPVQHLVGEAWVDGRAFYVNRHVLIPRFDTEVLIGEARKRLRAGMRVLDLCTGSGCVLISLLAGGIEVRGIGSDISSEALRIAQQNALRHGVLAEWIESDLFVSVEGRFDLITANPPYLATAEIDELAPEVRDHDPRIALDGGADGLNFYRRLIPEAVDHLCPGGWLLLETGATQAKAVRELLSENAYRETEVIRDLAGADRVVLGRYRDETE